MKPLISFSFIYLITLSTACASAEDAATIAANENTAITRWATGKYMYRVSEDMRQRGFEEWRLSVHADGSRTFTMWYSVFEDSLDTTAVLRLDKNFRPLSLYKTTWIGEKMTNTHAVVNGNTVETWIQVDGEVASGTLEVPDRFSMMVGPIVADALHFGAYDKEKGGVQRSTILASVSAGGEDTPIGKATESSTAMIGLSNLTPIDLEWVGVETVKVAAGVFETDHYRMPGIMDMWLIGEDLTMVKYLWHPNAYEYELVEYNSGP